MSSQKQKKDDYIHIRIKSEIKEILKKKAKDKDLSLSEYILESVMTDKSVMTKNTSKELKTLVEGVRELNEFMRYNKDRLQAPDNIDGIKITKAVKLSWEIRI